MQYNSPSWNNYFNFLSRWEGGQSNDATDTASTQVKKGQIHTNRGITWATWQTLANKINVQPTYDNFLKMTRDQAKQIAWQYYLESGAGKLTNVQVSLLFFEIAWGSGLQYAISHLKAALVNLGYINRKLSYSFPVLVTIANQHPEQVYKELIKVRTGFYKQIVENNPSQAKFLDGWLNRLTDFQKKFIFVAGGGSLIVIAGILIYLTFLNNN